LLNPVDWVAGEVIVVTSTNYTMSEAEKRTIVAKSADNKTLTLD